ncbi:unnamed protein product [Closterium sp. NIES-53]
MPSQAALLGRAAPPSRAAPPTEPCRSVEPRRPGEPRRTFRAALPCRAEPHCPFAYSASAATTATAASTATAATATMASPTVLTFDAEGRAVDFDVWWATRDAVACLAVRSHLPPAERARFGQYKTAQSLYDAVVARYSYPATAALSRLMLPYLFPELAAFATVADLVAHLRTSDACYRAALPTEFCAKNPPPPCASRRDPRAPFFEGCSPVPLLPSVASAAAVDLVGTEEVGAASAPSGRRRHSGGGGGGGGGGGEGGGAGGGGGGGGNGSGGFSGDSGGGGGSGSGGGGSSSGGGGDGGGGAGRGAAAQRGGFGGSQH